MKELIFASLLLMLISCNEQQKPLNNTKGDSIVHTENDVVVVEQLSGLEKTTEPVGGEGFPNLGPEDLSPTDPVYYMNYNHMDIYFGKVKGYFKLVKTVNPG